MPVGRAEHIGGGEQASEIAKIEETIEKQDVVFESQLANPVLQAVAVALALGAHDLRMRPPCDHVHDIRHGDAYGGHRFESDLDPLAGGQQPEARDHRPARHAEPVLRVVGIERLVQLRWSAVRHDAELARAHEVLLEHQPPSSRGEDHDGPRSVAKSSDDAGLVLGRAGKHRVHRNHERDVERVDEVEDQLSVRPTEDPELVLEQDHVEAIGDARCFFIRRSVLLTDGRHDVRPELLRVADDCRNAGTFQAISSVQRLHDIGGERSDATHSRRVRTNNESAHEPFLPYPCRRETPRTITRARGVGGRGLVTSTSVGAAGPTGSKLLRSPRLP